MPNIAITNFIQKIHEKEFRKSQYPSTKPPIKKALKQCLIELQFYVNQEIDIHTAGVIFNKSTIADWIFRQEFKSSEEAQYYRLNLLAAQVAFNQIIESISLMKGGMSYNNILKCKSILIDFLHDIDICVCYFRKQTDPNYIFFDGFKKYITTSHECYQASKNLFYNSLTKENWLPYKESQGIISSLLRQSIEIKIKRVLGIYNIHKNPRIQKDYSFKLLFKFYESNKDLLVFNAIDYEVLRKVYAWCCVWVHNGELSYIWQTYFAIKFMNNLFVPGTHLTDKKATWSTFGAFKILDYEELKRRVSKHIGNNYKITFLPASNVEAIVVK